VAPAVERFRPDFILVSTGQGAAPIPSDA